ncbi:MAG: hypothetical protein PVSMB7_01040 [Chloroflexota bacterium]
MFFGSRTGRTRCARRVGAGGASHGRAYDSILREIAMARGRRPVQLFPAPLAAYQVVIRLRQGLARVGVASGAVRGASRIDGKRE